MHPAQKLFAEKAIVFDFCLVEIWWKLMLIHQGRWVKINKFLSSNCTSNCTITYCIYPRSNTRTFTIHWSKSEVSSMDVFLRVPLFMVNYKQYIPYMGHSIHNLHSKIIIIYNIYNILYTYILNIPIYWYKIMSGCECIIGGFSYSSSRLHWAGHTENHTII